MFPMKYYLSLVPVGGNKREMVTKDNFEGIHTSVRTCIKWFENCDATPKGKPKGETKNFGL